MKTTLSLIIVLMLASFGYATENCNLVSCDNISKDVLPIVSCKRVCAKEITGNLTGGHNRDKAVWKRDNYLLSQGATIGVECLSGLVLKLFNHEPGTGQDVVDCINKKIKEYLEKK